MLTFIKQIQVSLPSINFSESFRNFPGLFVKVLRSLRNIPEPIMNVHEPSGNFPQLLRNIAELPGKVIRSLRNVPEPFDRVPLSLRNFPEQSGEFPQLSGIFLSHRGRLLDIRVIFPNSARKFTKHIKY